MKKLFVFVLAAGISISAHAGSATDALSQCLADSTTGRDRTNLLRWLVAAMSQHPAMNDISSPLSPEKLDATNKLVGLLYNRLMEKDCTSELKKAIQIEGPAAVSKGFETLGRLAMQEIMANPQVAASMAGPVKYIDTKKINELTLP